MKKTKIICSIGPSSNNYDTFKKLDNFLIDYYEELKDAIKIFDKDPMSQREEIAKQTASVFGQRSQLLYHLPLIDSFNFFRINC